jgi:tetratricopeptide (TPR) repeat protein
LVKPIAAQIDATRPVVASNGDAVRRSLEQEVLGDKKLRLRKWSEACAYYRQSVDAADDRARVHLRLGFAYVALNHFTLAQREFKRGLALDPAIANDGDNLATIFGPESDPIRKSIQQQIAAWVRNDIRDADRLFLLGLWLHYDDDPRSREVLEAALNRAGEASHIAALLRPSNESSREYDQARLATAPELPTLNTIPVPVDDEDHSHSQLDLSQQVQTLPPPPPPLADDGQ